MSDFTYAAGPLTLFAFAGVSLFVVVAIQAVRVWRLYRQIDGHEYDEWRREHEWDI